MISFVNDDNESLEIDDDLVLTKQAVSLLTSKIKGDFSIDFEIDNNSETRKILGYYGPQMTSQIAFSKQAFNLTRNGNIIKRGYIVIQEDDTKKLNCFFVSGNSNWIRNLDGLITDLNYDYYARQIIASVVESRMSASEGIVFPLIDFCYEKKKGDNRWNISYIQDVTIDVNAYFFDLYPCFYLKSLVTEIFNQNDLKLDGNILDDPIYNSIIIPPVQGIMKRESRNEIIILGSAFTPTTTYQLYDQFNNEEKDNDDLFAGDTFTANKSRYYTIVLVCVTTSMGIDPDRFMNIAFYKNGVNVYEADLPDTVSATPGGPGAVKDELRLKYIKARIQMNSGDTLQVYVRNNAFVTGTPTVTIDLRIDPERVGLEEYVTPDNFLPKLKSIDIIKFIINFFGCSVYFDDFSKTVNINIMEKFKREDAEDWSEYYLSHRIEYTSEFGENNYLRIQESEDESIKRYNNRNKQKYGEGNIITERKLNPDYDLLSIPFGATVFDRAKNNDFLSEIKLVNLIDDGEPSIYTSITNSGGLASYTGTGFNFKEGEIVRLVNSQPASLGYFIVTNQTGTTVRLGANTFVATDSGKIYKQRIEFLQTNPRILLNKPSTPISDFCTDSSITLLDKNGVTSSLSSAAFAHYSKFKTGKNIDGYKGNLAFSNPVLGDFPDPEIQDLYFNAIKKMISNPKIHFEFLLPEVAFLNYSFSNYVYLKTKDLSGYFFIDRIDDYKDGNTVVHATAYMNG